MNSVRDEMVALIRSSHADALAATELGDDLDLLQHLASIDVIRLLAQLEAHFDVDLFVGSRSEGRGLRVGELVALVTAERGARE